MNRREFLAGSLATVAFGCKQPESNPQIPHEPQSEIKLPEDIIPKEELQQMGIEIFNTPTTELHFREFALGLPVFQDAMDKKIRLGILLVDTQEITDEQVEFMPPDFQELYRAKMYFARAGVEQSTRLLRFAHEERELNEKQYKNKEVTYERYTDKKRENDRAFNHAQTYFDTSSQDAQPYGLYGYGNQLNDIDVPVTNKNFVGIILPVGGRYTPNPQNSYPTGENHTREKFNKERATGGELLRYYLLHHPSNSNFIAAQSVTSSLEFSALKKQQGDTRAYPLVLQTASGLEIA